MRWLLVVLVLGCGSAAERRGAVEPSSSAPVIGETVAPLSDEAWAACAARIPREPGPDGLVVIRPRLALPAVAPDDACARASTDRDEGFYGAVRQVALEGLPYIAVGRDVASPRLASASERASADEVVVQLPPLVEPLGCRPMSGPARDGTLRAAAHAELDADAMYWVGETTLPIRFVRDEVAAYDRCVIVDSLAEARSAPIPDGLRAEVEQALADVDFAEQRAMFDPGDVDDQLAVATCVVDGEHLADERDRRPWCNAEGPLVVTTWRDAEPPCRGDPPPPGTSSESSWRPIYVPQLVVVPRRDGAVMREVRDLPVGPPCA